MHIDWEQRYRSGDTPWDKGADAPALRSYFEKEKIEGAQRVLVPGCGRGHDVRLLAGYGYQVTGADLSKTAIQEAKAYPVVAEEIYAWVDVFEPPNAWTNTFDGVVEHTCFCAIPESRRAEYVRSMAAILKAEAWFVGVFFTSIPDASSESPPWPIDGAALDALFSTYFDCEQSYLVDAQYESRKGCREELRCFRKRSE